MHLQTTSKLTKFAKDTLVDFFPPTVKVQILTKFQVHTRINDSTVITQRNADLNSRFVVQGHLSVL